VRYCSAWRERARGISKVSHSLIAKAHKGCLDNRIAAKLRLVDDARHLLLHLTPESATEFLIEVETCVSEYNDHGSDSRCSSQVPPAPPSGHIGLFASSSSQHSEPEELEPDFLQCWYRGQSDEARQDTVLVDGDGPEPSDESIVPGFTANMDSNWDGLIARTKLVDCHDPAPLAESAAAGLTAPVICYGDGLAATMYATNPIACTTLDLEVGPGDCNCACEDTCACSALAGDTAPGLEATGDSDGDSCIAKTKLVDGDGPEPPDESAVPGFTAPGNSDCESLIAKTERVDGRDLSK